MYINGVFGCISKGVRFYYYCNGEKCTKHLSTCSVNDFNHGGDIRTATCRCVLCSIAFRIEVVVNVFAAYVR